MLKLSVRAILIYTGGGGGGAGGGGGGIGTCADISHLAGGDAETGAPPPPYLSCDRIE